jgi:hypothetical protein
MEATVTLRRPHPKQQAFVECVAKRIIIRAGRRGGKTTGIAQRHVKKFLAGHRCLYGAPTQDQIERYWFEVTVALKEPIATGIFKKNETDHTIEVVGTEQRIKAKTMWNADTARGDYAEEVALDEFQMMDEEVWTKVVAPMMLDRNGTTVFIYTPPSAERAARSKARDPMYSAKLFQRAQEDKSGRWATFTFTSHDNPHLSKVALSEITLDMDERSYRQEILAEDIWETPGAIWDHDLLERTRVQIENAPTWYETIIVAMDPSASSNKGSDECGISVEGLTVEGRALTIEDLSSISPPDKWAADAVGAVAKYRGMCRHIEICAESNAGGEMILTTINPVADQMGVPEARMTKQNLIPSIANKFVRAQPVRARWETECGIVGTLERMEYQMCNWLQGAGWSPDRMDAMVIGKRKLLLQEQRAVSVGSVDL